MYSQVLGLRINNSRKIVLFLVRVRVHEIVMMFHKLTIWFRKLCLQSENKRTREEKLSTPSKTHGFRIHPKTLSFYKEKKKKP